MFAQCILVRLQEEASADIDRCEEIGESHGEDSRGRLVDKDCNRVSTDSLASFGKGTYYSKNHPSHDGSKGKTLKHTHSALDLFPASRGQYVKK